MAARQSQPAAAAIIGAIATIAAAQGPPMYALCVLIYRCAARTRLTPLVAPHCSDEGIAYFCPQDSCFTTVQPLQRNDSSGLPVGICVTRSVSGAIENVITPEVARNPCV